MLLDTSPRYRLHNQGDRHTLNIQEVGIEDFANYSCRAMNSMGRSEGTIELRGMCVRVGV